MLLSTNPFPSLYYVYEHFNPFTEEILYIGHGKGSRAWIFNEPLRSEEHARCLVIYATEAGLIPTDWTRILHKGLSKTEACKIERGLIRDKRPLFNKIQGAKLLKVTPEILDEAFKLREEGWSFSQIAENFDLATMTIHRAMNGGSPALEEIIARQ